MNFFSSWNKMLVISIALVVVALIIAVILYNTTERSRNKTKEESEKHIIVPEKGERSTSNSGGEVSPCTFEDPNLRLYQMLPLASLKEGEIRSFKLPRTGLETRCCFYNGQVAQLSSSGDDAFVVKAVSGNPKVYVRFYVKIHR